MALGAAVTIVGQNSDAFGRNELLSSRMIESSAQAAVTTGFARSASAAVVAMTRTLDSLTSVGRVDDSVDDSIFHPE